MDDLQRISIFAAKHIIVLGASPSPRVADSLALTTLCALKSMPERQTISPSTAVVVDLKLVQNVSVAKQLAGPTSRTITSASAIDELLALMTLEPTVGRAMLTLMSFVGAQIEVVPVTARFIAETSTKPCEFGTAKRRFKRAIVVGVALTGGADGAPSSPVRSALLRGFSGVRTESDHALFIAPSLNLELQEADLLLVVAQSHKEANDVTREPGAVFKELRETSKRLAAQTARSMPPLPTSRETLDNLKECCQRAVVTARNVQASWLEDQTQQGENDEEVEEPLDPLSAAAASGSGTTLPVVLGGVTRPTLVTWAPAASSRSAPPAAALVATALP